MDLYQKKEYLCDLAQEYLKSREQSHISINDGIFHSIDMESNKFLMFAAIVYSKEEHLSMFSIDSDVSEKIRIDFIQREFLKCSRLNESKVFRGKVLLDDAKEYYLKNCMNDEDIPLEKIEKHFNI